MDLGNAIVAAIAAGAASGLGENARQAVRDAYGQVKSLLKVKYGGIDVGGVEQEPQSDAKRAALAKDLVDAGATRDAELLSQVRALVESVERYAPETASGIGIELRTVRAQLFTTDMHSGHAIHVGGSVKGHVTIGPVTITNVRQARNIAVALVVAVIAVWFLVLAPVGRVVISVVQQVPGVFLPTSDPLATTAGTWRGIGDASSTTLTISRDGKVNWPPNCGGQLLPLSKHSYQLNTKCGEHLSLDVLLSDDGQTLIISPNDLAFTFRKA